MIVRLAAEMLGLTLCNEPSKWEGAREVFQRARCHTLDEGGQAEAPPYIKREPVRLAWMPEVPYPQGLGDPWVPARTEPWPWDGVVETIGVESAPSPGGES